MSTEESAMRNFRYLLLYFSIALLISAGILLLGACSLCDSSGSSPSDKTSLSSTIINSETTEVMPTGPDSGIYQMLNDETPLINLLDLNWKDVTNITLSKYQDNIKTAVELKDEASILQIKEIINQFSVTSDNSDSKHDPVNNTKYELLIKNKEVGVDEAIFLSVGPMFEDETFAIGGTFIHTQHLDPKKTLLQKNDQVTFDDVKKCFDGILEK